MGGERTQASLGRIGSYKPATEELNTIHYGIIEHVNEKDPLVVSVRTFFGIVSRVIVATNPASKEGYSFCPYKKGDGVILAFAGGNLNNPVIIGSLPERDRSQYELTYKTIRQRFMARADNPNEDNYNESDITADVDTKIDEKGNVTLIIKGLSGNLTIITDGEVNINNGEKGVARVGDKVKVTLPTGSVVVIPGSAAAIGVKNLVPLEIEGTIEEGSEKVKIG